MADQKRVLAICSTLTELADMAYRQKKLRFYAALVDAADLLTKKYPQETPEFVTDAREFETDVYSGWDVDREN